VPARLVLLASDARTPHFVPRSKAKADCGPTPRRSPSRRTLQISRR